MRKFIDAQMEKGKIHVEHSGTTGEDRVAISNEARQDDCQSLVVSGFLVAALEREPFNDVAIVQL
jgi:hypothetical protein